MKFRQPLARSGAVALALLMAGGAAHAVLDDLVRQALAMTESGQSRQAYDLLEPLEVRRAGDPDFDTVLGIAANQIGEHARAIMALERVTIVQPGNTRARAELGRAMFAVGDSKSARTLLQQAKDQGAPAQAALTIDQFLRAIDVAEAQMRSSVRAYVEVALGHDNNISSGPANANVAVPRIGGVVLLANAVKRSATFGNLAAGVSARHVIDSRWSLLGTASANKRVNFNESVFNNRQVNLAGGAAYRLDRHEFSGAMVIEDYKLDGTTNRTQRGLVGEWAYRTDDTRELGAYLQFSRLHYLPEGLRHGPGCGQRRGGPGARSDHATAGLRRTRGHALAHRQVRARTQLGSGATGLRPVRAASG